jgi:hypothetical protein
MNINKSHVFLNLTCFCKKVLYYIFFTNSLKFMNFLPYLLLTNIAISSN